MIAAFGLLIPIAVVVAVIVVVRAFSKKDNEHSQGGDLVAYILLAIFIGGLVWALFLLGRAAFPGQDLVGTSRDELAGALAGLIVAGPLAFYLWKRQDDRRNTYPDSVGWTLYLAFTDAVYLTWLTVYGVLIVTAILGDSDFPRWTDVIIVAGVVALHEWAARADQPGGNISQIRRVVGSAIGLVTLTIGVGLLLHSLFQALYSTITATAGDTPWEAAVAMTVVGGAVWVWRWLRPWTDAPDGTRLTYLVLVTYGSMLTMIFAVTALAVVVITYFLDQPTSPGSHFEPVTAILPAAITACLVWFHHRPRLGPERTDAVRSYDYLLMATGLVVSIASGVSLVTLVTRRNILVDNPATSAVALVLGFAAAFMLWWLFWSNAQEAPRETEAQSFPRRFYLVGMAIGLGLTTAGAVIGVLLFIFQALFSLDPEPSTLAIELTLAVLAGAATFHLYRQYKADAAERGDDEVEPYSLTVICAHPGPLADTLPKAAHLRVIHRGDGVGTIDQTMAEEIAAATLGQNSIVWVGADSFETALALKD